MFINFLDDISLPPERGLSYSLPNLIIESGSQLIKFKYNTQTHKYESQTTVDLEGTSPPTSWKLLTLSDSIIVARNIESRHNQQKRDKSPSKLIKLSRSLEQLKVYKCADVAAMATDGNYIFVCTEGKLVALNQDLEKLNEVDLEIQYQVLREKKKKNAHDILIHQSIAYLLDNIVEPTYILRVDISNPNNLQILSTFEIIGTNHHLRKQWINPELNQWCILQYYATQGGAGQNIIILPLDLDTGSIDIDQSQIPDPTDSLNERPVILDIQSSINRYNPFSRSRNSYNSLLGYESIGYSPFHSSKWLGLDLIATTSSYPTFSLVYQEKKQFFLTEVQTLNNPIKILHRNRRKSHEKLYYRFHEKLYYRIEFHKKLYLGNLKNCYYTKGRMRRINKLLFLVVQGHIDEHLFTRLLIIDMAQEPSTILNQNLEVQSLNNLSLSYLLLP